MRCSLTLTPRSLFYQPIRYLQSQTKLSSKQPSAFKSLHQPLRSPASVFEFKHWPTGLADNKLPLHFFKQRVVSCLKFFDCDCSGFHFRQFLLALEA